MWLSVTITNYGPANARDLDFTMTLQDPRGHPEQDWHLHEAVFPSGRYRTILPGWRDKKEIDQLIAENTSLVMEWSWAGRAWP